MKYSVISFSPMALILLMTLGAAEELSPFRWGKAPVYAHIAKSAAEWIRTNQPRWAYRTDCSSPCSRKVLQAKITGRAA